VLRPGGYLALDTPNGPVCRLHTPDFINHDHKIEYSEAELSAKLRAAGLEIVAIKGLKLPRSPAVARVVSMRSRSRANWGVFAEADDCYLLALPLPEAFMRASA